MGGRCDRKVVRTGPSKGNRFSRNQRLQAVIFRDLIVCVSNCFITDGNSQLACELWFFVVGLLVCFALGLVLVF